MRVVEQDSVDRRRGDGAEVEVALRPTKTRGKIVSLFEGRIGATGSLPVRFHVPADGPAEAQVALQTRSQVGKTRVEQPLPVERPYRLLLTEVKRRMLPDESGGGMRSPFLPNPNTWAIILPCK